MKGKIVKNTPKIISKSLLKHSKKTATTQQPSSKRFVTFVYMRKIVQFYTYWLTLSLSETFYPYICNNPKVSLPLHPKIYLSN